jgi:hypothetical protein
MKLIPSFVIFVVIYDFTFMNSVGKWLDVKERLVLLSKMNTKDFQSGTNQCLCVENMLNTERT